MLNNSTVLLLFALLAIVIGSPLWFDESDEDASATAMNFRRGAGAGAGAGAFRVLMPDQLESSLESSRRLLKRANSMFNKRRGRELFGKRSLPLGYADESAMYENRFRRRANELFG